MRYMIKSELMKSSDCVIECVRYHEDRWDARVRENGMKKLVDAHYEKFAKEHMTKEDEEHALLELAAAALYAYDKMKEDD